MPGDGGGGHRERGEEWVSSNWGHCGADTGKWRQKKKSYLNDFYISRPRAGTITGLTSGSRVYRLCARSTTLSTSWTRSRPAEDRLESKLGMSSLTIDSSQMSRMWCHEWFDLPEAPDIVTFSKKMLTGGLYHKPELRPKQAWRIFNTWVGDPSKVRFIAFRNH